MPGRTWRVSTHALGRGRFRADAAAVAGQRVRIALPAGTHDGGEIASETLHGDGVFGVVMRTPRAPGSISAFFLYERGADNADEIDIEIFNDGSRRAMFTVWRAGRQIESVDRVLPFDPAAAFHEYVIERADGIVRFSCAGLPLHMAGGDVPRARLDVRVSAWWPAWLQGPALPATAELLVRGVSV